MDGIIIVTVATARIEATGAITAVRVRAAGNFPTNAKNAAELAADHGDFPGGVDAIDAGSRASTAVRAGGEKARFYGTRATEDGIYGAGTPVTVAVRYCDPHPRPVDIGGRVVDTPEEDTLRNEGPGCDESPYEKRNKEPRINELGYKEPGIEDPRPQKPCER